MKRVGWDEPIDIRLTLEERDLILEHAFGGGELVARLRVSNVATSSGIGTTYKRMSLTISLSALRSKRIPLKIAASNAVCTISAIG